MFPSRTCNLHRILQASKKAPYVEGNRRLFSTTARTQAYVRFSANERPRNRLDGRKWDPRVKLLVLAGVAGSAYYVSNLERVPETGRWRYMAMSPEAESKLADKLYKELAREMGPNTLPLNHPITKHVRRVVSRVLHASNLGVLSGEKLPPVDQESTSWNPDVQYGAAAHPGPTYGPTKEWHVLVVNEKTINAMATPGTIVVFTGILPICQDEEGLAAIISHEIGHVVARHTAERLSNQTIYSLLAQLLYYTIGVDIGFTSIFQTLALELPNSRSHEREADLIGLRLMSRACYDPAAAPQVFGRLAQLESKIDKRLQFLQTHPSSASRVKFLEEALPQGYEILAANPECEAVRAQIESFKASARAITPDEHGDWGFA